MKVDNYEPYFDPITTAENDINDLKHAVGKYKIGDDDICHELINQHTTEKGFDKIYNEIETLLTDNPTKSYVIIQLFACHGIHKEGT